MNCSHEEKETRFTQWKHPSEDILGKKCVMKKKKNQLSFSHQKRRMALCARCKQAISHAEIWIWGWPHGNKCKTSCPWFSRLKETCR